MGYYMSMRGSKIRIPASKHDQCLAAIKALANTVADPFNSRNIFSDHYSWVRTHEFAGATTLREALAAWRWVDPDCVGLNKMARVAFKPRDIEDLRFTGEKLGDDEVLMHAIAPYVEAGSYIEMVGEDTDHWRWYFNGEGCVQQAGQVVYTEEAS